MTKGTRVARRGIVLALIAVACLLLAAVGVLAVAWLDRNTLGAQAAMRYLSRRGIPTTVKLTRLDLGGVEGSLVLGPRDHPTLTAPHFVAAFAPAPLFGVPRLQSLSLDRPRLEASYDGRRFDFHALQPLIDEASRAPKGAGPSPDLSITGGELDLQTPYGPITAEVDAVAPAGALRTADIRLRPTRLTAPTAAVEAAAGHVSIHAMGAGRYLVQGDLSASVVEGGRATLNQVEATFRAELPFAEDAKTPFAGRVHGEVHASAREISAEGALAAKTSVAATFQGQVSGAPDAPKFTGRAEARAQAASLRFGATTLDGPSLTATAPHLSLDAARTLDAAFRLGAAVHGGRTRIAAETVSLAPAQATAAGRLQAGAAGPRLDAVASFAGGGGLDPARATRLAANLAPGVEAAALRRALSAALVRSSVSAPGVRLSGDTHAWRAQFDRPLRVSTGGGAQLTLTGAVAGRTGSSGQPRLAGNGALLVSGGALPQTRLAVLHAEGDARHARASVEADASGTAGPLEGARLQLAATVDADADRARVALARCATLAVAAVRGQGPQPVAEGVHADVCPLAGAPLLATRGGAWSAAARLQDFEAAAPAAAVAVQQSDAEVKASGRGARLTGQAQLDQVIVSDTAHPARFGALRISGPIALADRRVTGTFEAALARAGPPLGRAQLSADLAAGAGALSFDAPHLAFSPGGLQPASVLPGLASLGREVKGPASATLALSWRGATTTTAARVHLDGLQLKTAAGLVTGVRTDLVLTGFTPLTSAPDQRLTADRLAAALPLTDLSATYALGGDALTLTKAQAGFAGGRLSLDPMRVSLSPGADLSGVVRVDDVDLGQVLDALNLSRAVSIQAHVAGTLPFSFGPHGLRIADGRLAAMGPGRLTLHRQALSSVAASAGGGASNSAMQDLAYQALENLAFSELDATVASRPQGRLGVVFHVRGRHDPPVAAPARIGLFALLRGHGFDKPIPLPKGTEVNLTLDSSLNLDDLLGAYLARGAAGSPSVQP